MVSSRKGTRSTSRAICFLFSAVRCALRPLYLVICPLSACYPAEQPAARGAAQHMLVIAHQFAHHQRP